MTVQEKQKRIPALSGTFTSPPSEKDRVRKMNLFCQAAGFKNKDPTEYELGKNPQIDPFHGHLTWKPGCNCTRRCPKWRHGIPRLMVALRQVFLLWRPAKQGNNIFVMFVNEGCD